ncbi:MAG: ribosomal RNA small subunit methyltransferase A [Ignavibacteriales bacterium]|nr:MAG: ribosomal RNA small subunit methyltransferase A [Ignavibacteriales bacterium]
MEKIKPLKKFGQNYLSDKNILRKIVNEINPSPDDSIIEIGPGLGALTELIFEKNENLSCVEIDSRAVLILKQKYPKLNIVQDDFLKIDLDKYSDGNSKLKVIGNIPYNITSPIIFRLIEKHSLISEAVFLIQLEVAKRMTAISGSKDYGILAVILQKFCDVRIAFKVSPNVFYPKPKVYSAVVHLWFKDLSINEDEKKVFIYLVKALFNNRRKTIKNSLSNSIFAGLDFSNSGIDLTKRAEQLVPENFESLTRFLLDEYHHQLRQLL